MWVVVERKQALTTRIIGPFNSAQDAAKWVESSYTRRIGTTATIEQLVKPEDAAKP